MGNTELDSALATATAALRIYDNSVVDAGLTADDWERVAGELIAARERLLLANAPAGAIGFIGGRATDAAHRTEVLRRQVIAVGSIVRLPDDEVGRVAELRGSDELDIVQDDRELGRGPWTFLREQVQLADELAVHSYSRAVARRRQRIPVIGGSASA